MSYMDEPIFGLNDGFWRVSFLETLEKMFCEEVVFLQPGKLSRFVKTLLLKPGSNRGQERHHRLHDTSLLFRL